MDVSSSSDEGEVSVITTMSYMDVFQHVNKYLKGGHEETNLINEASVMTGLKKFHW